MIGWIYSGCCGRTGVTKGGQKYFELKRTQFRSELELERFKICSEFLLTRSLQMRGVFGMKNRYRRPHNKQTFSSKTEFSELEKHSWGGTARTTSTSRQATGIDIRAESAAYARFSSSENSVLLVNVCLSCERGYRFFIPKTPRI